MPPPVPVAALAAMARRTPLTPHAFVPAPLADDEVEIEVARCALCHSDLHLVDDDWGISRYPLVPGHEIVGRVVARGRLVDDATGPALGALVGVGWQCGACGGCEACRGGREHQCSGGKRRTCVDQPGGLAARVRAQARFAFPLPAALDPVLAAPLMCAGVTTYSPLERLLTRPGMTVGVVGLGGLGHLAVQFAARMGAEVHAFDPAADKAAEARALGAAALHGVGSDALARLGPGRLDVVLTATHADLDWNAWLAALRLGGTLCLVGVPSKPLAVHPDHLLDGEKQVTGSIIGSPGTMRRMLDFAARHDVRPRVESLPMAQANEALDRVRRGAARYRMVLEGPPL